jgi:hypothetical protein
MQLVQLERITKLGRFASPKDWLNGDQHLALWQLHVDSKVSKCSPDERSDIRGDRAESCISLRSSGLHQVIQTSLRNSHRFSLTFPAQSSGNRPSRTHR